MSENENRKTIIIAHVSEEIEAVSTVAALNDGGIDAGHRASVASGTASLFKMPGMMGGGALDGYDILIDEADYDQAAEILCGIGMVDLSQISEEEEAESSEISGEDTSDTAEDEAEEVPQERRFSSFWATLLILILIAVAVIGTDYIVELIKQLF